MAILNLIILNTGRRASKGYFIKFYPMPYDVHLRILDDYLEDLEKKELEQDSSSMVTRLLNSLRFTNDSVSKLACMICKTPIEKGDILSKCLICKANYHENHLEEYIESEQAKGKPPKCAVCKNIFTLDRNSTM